MRVARPQHRNGRKLQQNNKITRPGARELSLFEQLGVTRVLLLCSEDSKGTRMRTTAHYYQDAVTASLWLTGTTAV